MLRVGEHGDIERYLSRKAEQQRAITRKHSWRYLWPTPKQAAVFADRSMPKPATRGEAADEIRHIALREGWGIGGSDEA